MSLLFVIAMVFEQSQYDFILHIGCTIMNKALYAILVNVTNALLEEDNSRAGDEEISLGQLRTQLDINAFYGFI